MFTDGQGQFRIIALQAGVYKVTLSLTGFGTVVRDAITLTSSFTATVNVTMSVGALQESVTVSSQSPLVDIQTTSQKTPQSAATPQRAAHRTVVPESGDSRARRPVRSATAATSGGRTATCGRR